MSRLLVDLKTPEAITYNEVVTFWKRIRVRLWCGNYTVYLSPNGDLKAWTRGAEIVVLWNKYTGKHYKFDSDALHDLVDQIHRRVIIHMLKTI